MNFSMVTNLVIEIAETICKDCGLKLPPTVVTIAGVAPEVAAAVQAALFAVPSSAVSVAPAASHTH